MNKILIILSLVVLVSYPPNAVPNEVPYKDLVERNGIKYEVFSKVPFTGSFVRYYENGQLRVKGNYKEGKEHGLRESYFKNGQLRIKGNHKDGKRNGLWEWYYENGKLMFKDCYKNGGIIDMSYCEK